MVATGSKVALAFGLNIGAGLSTCIGGIVIFNKKLVNLANPSTMSIALGVAAGVMIFISLEEIFEESVNEFRKGLRGNDQEDCDAKCNGNSRLFATLCFVIGAILIYLIDFIVHKISPDFNHELNIDKLNALRRRSPELNSEHESNSIEVQISPRTKKGFHDEATKRTLNRTGILTAIAVAIHNIPEGVATYIGAMKTTKLGVALAIAIALHNIPEGIAIAIPVYFSTRSKLKAFLWTFLSALAEPLGGVIGWLVAGEGLNANINGVLFGLVVGMMVTISVKELIPTAYYFCSSKDKITYSILIGMCIMALSLILLDYAGV